MTGGVPAQAWLSGLGRVPRTTRREQVLGVLRDAVASGRIAAGTHLAEVELSEAFDVSRGTLREAMRHLEQEGLLVADSRGRLSVRVVSAQEVRDIFAVRGALEALAAEVLCVLPDRAPVVAALRAQLARMDDASASFADRVTEDLALHELLCASSGNATLLASWRGVGGLARAAVTAAGPQTALANMATDRHAPVADLVEAGDGAGARDFLVRHMAEAADQVVEHLPPPRA